MKYLAEDFLKIFTKQIENRENKIFLYCNNTQINAPVIGEL